MQTRRVEVFRVAGAGSPADAGRGAMCCDSAAASTLRCGYYLALGSGASRGVGCEDGLNFYGPLATEAQARLLAVSARALGLTQGLVRPPRTRHEMKM